MSYTHKLAHPARGFRSEIALDLTSGAPGLGGIEPNKAHVRLPLVKSYRITVDHTNGVRINRLSYGDGRVD